MIARPIALSQSHVGGGRHSPDAAPPLTVDVGGGAGSAGPLVPLLCDLTLSSWGGAVNGGLDRNYPRRFARRG